MRTLIAGILLSQEGTAKPQRTEWASISFCGNRICGSAGSTPAGSRMEPTRDIPFRPAHSGSRYRKSLSAENAPLSDPLWSSSLIQNHSSLPPVRQHLPSSTQRKDAALRHIPLSGSVPSLFLFFLYFACAFAALICWVRRGTILFRSPTIP